MPCSVKAASDASLANVSPCPPSLRAWTASIPGQRPARTPKNPGATTESASSMTTASHSSPRACSSPAWRAAARPGSPPGRARAPRRRSAGRSSRSRRCSDRRRPRPGRAAAVGVDRPEAPVDHVRLVVSGHEDEEADPVAVPGRGLAIEQRRDRQQPEVRGRGKTGKADREGEDDDADIARRAPPGVRDGPETRSGSRSGRRRLPGR